jgi:protein involved in polysaccharide export with SLBB domain
VMLKSGDLTGDLALRDGDVLILPRASRAVTLLGEFQKPGTYPFAEGNTLAQAVALGQGPTPAADLRRAVLKRAGQEIPIDLYALLKEGEDAQDRALQDGDTLFVPAGTRILTYGAFGKPGPVVVTQGMGLFEVLAAAGGTTREARLEKAQIARLIGNERVPIRLDLKAAVEKGAVPTDFRFAEGDVLYVPEKGKELNWQGLVSAAYMLSITVDRLWK